MDNKEFIKQACGLIELISDTKESDIKPLEAYGEIKKHLNPKIPFYKIVKEHKLTDIEAIILLFTIQNRLFSRASSLTAFKIMDILGFNETFEVIVLGKSPLFEKNLLTSVSRDIMCNNLTFQKILGITPKKAKPEKIPLPKSALQICTDLSRGIVGQPEAIKSLSVSIFEHLIKCSIRLKKDVSFNKNAICLLSPSGTGKTFLAESLAKVLKIPYLNADCTNFSATGYVGRAASDVIIEAHRFTKSTDKLPPMIIIFDEFDKIASKPTIGRDISGRSVQEELLRMVESKSCTLESKSGQSLTLDISQVFFIFAGAFTDLKLQDKKVGFTPATEQQDILKKLEEYGMMTELLGRIGNFCILNELTEQNLIDIATKPENSILSQYKLIFKEAKLKEPKISTQELKSMAQTALTKGTGARGMISLISKTMQQKLLETKH